MGAASTTLKFLLIGEDRLSPAFHKAGDEADKSAKKIGATSKVMTGLKVAGAAAGLGLVGLFKTGFDEASDAAAGTAQLAAGIKSTGNAANVTVGGLNDLAGSIQSYSGQTDDSIVASEKLLLTFTGIHNSAGKNNDIFNQATKATADMAAKMGGDASKYAVQLGKALNNPIKGVTALQKIGVSFTDSQKKTIASMVKMGNTAGAQKIILGELHKEFGGAAKAAGDSLPGQLARSKRAFEDVAQSVVTQLMPVITGLSHFMVADVMPAFKAITGFIMSHKTVFLALAGVIGAIVISMKAFNVVQGISAVLAGEQAAATGLQTLALGVQKVALGASTAAQWLFNAAMDANPIGIVIIAIAALAAGLIVAYKKSATFRSIVQGAFNGIKRVVEIMWPILKGIFKVWSFQFIVIGKAAMYLWRNVIQPAASGISSALRGAGNGLTWVWRNVIRPTFGFVKAGIRGVRDFLKPIVSGINKVFSSIGNGLVWAYSHIIKPVTDTILSIISTILDSWDYIKSGGQSQGSAKLTGKPTGNAASVFGHATGGTVSDGLFTSGERGTELGFKQGNTVRFFSHAASGPMLDRAHREKSHGGGDTYNITLGVFGDPKSAAKVLLTELQRLKGSGTQLNLA